MRKAKLQGILSFLSIENVSLKELDEMVSEFKETGTFSNQEKADSIAKQLSEKLKLKHTAAEWMASLIHFANI